MTADTLSAPYVPTLIQYEDRIEYVIKDVPTFVWSITPEFGILVDIKTRLPVGFCLAGKHVAGSELLALGEAAVRYADRPHDRHYHEMTDAARAYAASVAEVKHE